MRASPNMDNRWKLSTVYSRFFDYQNKATYQVLNSTDCQSPHFLQFLLMAETITYFGATFLTSISLEPSYLFSSAYRTTASSGTTLSPQSPRLSFSTQKYMPFEAYESSDHCPATLVRARSYLWRAPKAQLSLNCTTRKPSALCTSLSNVIDYTEIFFF